MSEAVRMLKAFTTLGFDRLERATKDLKEEQLDWKCCPEANTIRWVLTHIAEELHVFIPKILAGNKDYKPKGWPEDYTGNTSYSLEKIMGDLESGRAKFLKSLDEIDADSLSEEIDWFYGKRPRESYLMLAISEIHHHEGQIAAILGLEKRMKGLD